MRVREHNSTGDCGFRTTSQSRDRLSLRKQRNFTIVRYYISLESTQMVFPCVYAFIQEISSVRCNVGSKKR